MRIRVGEEVDEESQIANVQESLKLDMSSQDDMCLYIYKLIYIHFMTGTEHKK